MRFFANFFIFLFFLINDVQAYAFPWWSQEKPPASFNLSHVLDLQQSLSSKIIGQPYAIKALADMMSAYAAKIHDDARPIGCLLFIGTTGVGKTELAKTLAKEISSSLDQFIHFNMSEFNNDREGLNRLIGMPWGYINNEKGGELSNAILKNPYSVVLLDEFEKADEKVRLLFLHIFDEGYFTSAKGENVNCKNCIFIATTNLNSQIIENGWKGGLNYDQVLNLIEPRLIAALTPELYARMEPILFQNISEPALKQIIQLKLEEVARRLKEKRNIELNFDVSVSNYIFTQCRGANNGARSVLGIINRDVLSAIAKTLIKNPYKECDRFRVVYAENGLRFSQL
jgi:ATP-dependent Clp protease ATP-binding subunit ClpB